MKTVDENNLSWCRTRLFASRCRVVGFAQIAGDCQCQGAKAGRRLQGDQTPEWNGILRRLMNGHGITETCGLREARLDPRASQPETRVQLELR